MSNLFNPKCIVAHLRRAEQTWLQHDFLFQRVADEMRDRLRDIKRDLPRVLEIGTTSMVVTNDIQQEKKIQQFDSFAPHYGWESSRIIDPQQPLPLEPQTYDAIISVCHAHWVEDLPGFLIQLRHALKPDGVLVMALFGGETLTELRHVITQIELEKLGGISPRISPFATLLDMASLMQRAGYHLPVTDHDTWQVTYKDVHALVRDLRGMGQTNAVQAQSKNILPKDFWPEVDRAYRDQFGLPDGRLPVTVEVLFATGWAFDATQPQPLKRGSGVVSLTSILEK